MEAASRALAEGYNQYAITWGSPNLRQAIAEKVRWFNGIEADPERNITVTCGATEAMIATLLATVNPGDEVIVFEPFYENYGVDTLMSGAVPRYIPLRLEPGFPFDADALRDAIGPRTKAIIVTTPHNPTGKVFTRAELELIADLCRRHNLLAVTDEVYEHIIYDGCEHLSIASLPGMAERTVTVNSSSKSYGVTGWRVGWTIAPAAVANGIRKVHDFLTVGAAAPLQEAVATALRFPRQYYTDLGTMYQQKRDTLLEMLRSAGFECVTPSGRVLHHVRHHAVRLRERRGVHDAHDRARRGRPGARVVVLQRAGRRPEVRAVRVSEARRDVRRGPHPPRAAARVAARGHDIGPSVRPMSAPVRPDVRAEVRSWEAYRDEFPVFQRATYLNTCSLGALGTRVRRAVTQFLDLWDERGASAWYGPWGQELDALRASVARLLGAEESEIAWRRPSAGRSRRSRAASTTVQRPRIVVADIDFPTLAYQWLARAAEGAEVVFVRSPDGLGVPLEAFEQAIDERTQLVATSHVYFQSGVVQDLGALARLAHARGAHLLVDAYQGAGQVPIDVRALDVDFLIAGGLKWLLGGPGIAYLYARGDLVPRLRPAVSGWFAHRRQFAFDTTHFELADGARRLEAGTPSVAAVYAARAGLEYVHEIGVERIRARQVELLTALADGLAAAGLRPRVRGGAEDPRRDRDGPGPGSAGRGRGARAGRHHRRFAARGDPALPVLLQHDRGHRPDARRPSASPAAVASDGADLGTGGHPRPRASGDPRRVCRGRGSLGTLYPVQCVDSSEVSASRCGLSCSAFAAPRSISSMRPAARIPRPTPLGRVGRGLVVLLGVRLGDTPEDADALAGRVVGLRIFADEAGRLNRSIQDVGGEVLSIPQFTLYADTRARAAAELYRRGAPGGGGAAVPALQ